MEQEAGRRRQGEKAAGREPTTRLCLVAGSPFHHRRMEQGQVGPVELQQRVVLAHVRRRLHTPWHTPSVSSTSQTVGRIFVFSLRERDTNPPVGLHRARGARGRHCGDCLNLGGVTVPFISGFILLISAGGNCDAQHECRKLSANLTRTAAAAAAAQHVAEPRIQMPLDGGRRWQEEREGQTGERRQVGAGGVGVGSPLPPPLSRARAAATTPCW